MLAFHAGEEKERRLEIRIQHSGGARFIAEARQHRVVIDQPTEDGATDHGMTPAEFLLVALGSSLGQHVAQYLQMRRLPADKLAIRVGAARAAQPLRISEFQVEIIAPGLNERQLKALERSLPAGLVHNALSRENSIGIVVRSADPVEDPL